MPMFKVECSQGKWSTELDAYNHHDAAIDAAAPRVDWENTDAGYVRVTATDDAGITKTFNVWRKLRPEYGAKEVVAGGVG